MRIPPWALLLWTSVSCLAFVALALHLGWFFSQLWVLAPFALIGAQLVHVLLALPP
ncbi:hypothetical protein [Nonomuraea sp. JJY05]|uniref:hypothetical protein n=1 Tax=Nonomuraea sp. JJY05 TaxID=3350255 RepID=UPI00373E4E27